MSSHAEEIAKALDILHLTCDEIQASNGCEKCPLRECGCLDGNSPLDLAEDVTKDMWQKFLDYSDTVSEEDDEEKDKPTEREIEELWMEEYYQRLPRRTVVVYGHDITIIG